MGMQSKSAILVNWAVTSDGGSVITGYKLYQTNVTTGGEFLVLDGTNIPTVTSAKITKVIGGHTYKYRVLATNRVGDSLISPFSQVILAASLPEQPN